MSVVSEMAPLTHRSEIYRIAVFRCAIEMGHCQNYVATKRFGLRVVDLAAALAIVTATLAEAFAPTSRSFAYRSGNFGPVLGVSLFVLSTNRHNDEDLFLSC